jgi:protein-tyrosine phosphatase
MYQGFTDLHTHILPAVDDGPKDLETALNMLRMQKRSGVQRVLLTPHFYPYRETLESFLQRRQQAYDSLMSQWCEDSMPILRLGAEVRYTSELVNVDLRALTYGDYLLLELSNSELPFIEQVLEFILQQGITPILAHIERCRLFRLESERLIRLIKMGALAQVTARAVVNKDDHRFAKTCLEKGLAHITASDLHVPVEEKCLGNVAQKMDDQTVRRAEEFAQCIWDNERPPSFSVYPIKRNIFVYR